MSGLPHAQRALRLSTLIATVVLIAMTEGCSPVTDARLLGTWTGPYAGTATATYKFQEGGNLDVKLSSSDTPYPSKWTVLSWEGEELSIQLYDYQQNPLVRKIRFDGADAFEMFDEAGTSLGKFAREAPAS